MICRAVWRQGRSGKPRSPQSSASIGSAKEEVRTLCKSIPTSAVASGEAFVHQLGWDWPAEKLASPRNARANLTISHREVLTRRLYWKSVTFTRSNRLPFYNSFNLMALDLGSGIAVSNLRCNAPSLLKRSRLDIAPRAGSCCRAERIWKRLRKSRRPLGCADGNAGISSVIRA